MPKGSAQPCTPFGYVAVMGVRGLLYSLHYPTSPISPSGGIGLRSSNVAKKGFYIKGGVRVKSCYKIELIDRKNKLYFYFTIRGGSLKNIAKKIMPKVPISKDA